jgi:hypothetical protein
MPILVANGTTDAMVAKYGSYAIAKRRTPNWFFRQARITASFFQFIDAFIDEVKAFIAA